MEVEEKFNLRLQGKKRPLKMFDGEPRGIVGRGKIFNGEPMGVGGNWKKFSITNY